MIQYILIAIIVALIILYLNKKCPKQKECDVCPEQKECDVCPEQKECPEPKECPEQKECPEPKECPVCSDQKKNKKGRSDNSEDDNSSVNNYLKKKILDQIEQAKKL